MAQWLRALTNSCRGSTFSSLNTHGHLQLPALQFQVLYPLSSCMPGVQKNSHKSKHARHKKLEPTQEMRRPLKMVILLCAHFDKAELEIGV